MYVVMMDTTTEEANKVGNYVSRCLQSLPEMSFLLIKAIIFLNVEKQQHTQALSNLPAVML